MTSSQSSTRPRTSRARRAGWVVPAIVGVMLVLSGCGGGSSDNSASTSGAAADSPQAFAGGGAGSAQDPGVSNANSIAEHGSAAADVSLVGRSLIKTAAVSLQSSDIATVIRKIDEYAATAGGAISSEDTNTDTHGTEVRTRIVLSVPAASFDRSVETISRLGDLVARTRSSQDVTSRVVDVASRVTSARDSIAQLRDLYRRATKLGQVIALERELSTREANLEALMAEQRSLASSTQMSTITVNVSRPAVTAAADKADTHAGFLSGLKQGWHGMVVFVVGSAHALGLVLPLGVIAVLAALLVFWAVRRFTPRREPHPSE